MAARSSLLALALAAACGAPRPGPVAANLPTQAVLARDGGPVGLAEVAAGRPLVVDLYATWCEACRESVPRMNALRARYAEADVAVVGVDVGEGVSAAEFADRLGMKYPVFFDPDFAFADRLGVSGLPAVLVFDRGGALVHRGKALDAAALDAVTAAVRQVREAER